VLGGERGESLLALGDLRRPIVRALDPPVDPRDGLGVGRCLGTGAGLTEQRQAVLEQRGVVGLQLPDLIEVRP